MNDSDKIHALALAQELYREHVETTGYLGWAVLLMVKMATEDIPRVCVYHVNSKDKAHTMCMDRAKYFYSFKHPENEWMSAYYFNCEGGN